MALINEGELQGNVQQLLAIAKKNSACCNGVAAVTWATSSIVGGPVFVTITKGGSVTVYTQPGGTIITDYGVLTPA